MKRAPHATATDRKHLPTKTDQGHRGASVRLRGLTVLLLVAASPGDAVHRAHDAVTNGDLDAAATELAREAANGDPDVWVWLSEVESARGDAKAAAQARAAVEGEKLVAVKRDHIRARARRGHQLAVVRTFTEADTHDWQDWVEIWDDGAERPWVRWRVPMRSDVLAWTDDGRVVSAWGGALDVRDPVTGASLTLVDAHPDRTADVAYDGDLLWSVGDDRLLKGWTLAPGRVSVPTHRFELTGETQSQMRVYTLEPGGPLHETYPMTSPSSPTAVVAAGGRAAVAMDNGSILLPWYGHDQERLPLEVPPGRPPQSHA